MLKEKVEVLVTKADQDLRPGLALGEVDFSSAENSLANHSASSTFRAEHLDNLLPQSFQSLLDRVRDSIKVGCMSRDSVDMIAHELLPAAGVQSARVYLYEAQFNKLVSRLVIGQGAGRLPSMLGCIDSRCKQTRLLTPSHRIARYLDSALTS